MATLTSLIVNDTGFIKLPVGTADQRPTPAQGQLRFNSSRGEMEIYNGSRWISAQIEEPAIVTSGLVLYLDAGNVSSYPGTGTIWYDLSGNGNVSLDNGPAYLDNYFTFTAASSQTATVTLPTNFNKLVGTIDMWVYASSYSTSNGLFVNRSDSTANAVDWFWIGSWDSGNTFCFRLGDGTTCCANDLTISSFSTVCPINTWKHICVTWQSGANSSIYIDGVVRNTRTISSIPSTNPSTTGKIGLGHDSTNDYWNGRISTVKFYNRVLSAAEIYQNFSALRARYGLPNYNPINTSTPTISGSAYETVTLTAEVGSWSNSPSSYTYQWNRNGSAISGATNSTYKLGNADVGSTVSVTVTAINFAGKSGSVTSSATGTVVIAATGGTTSISGNYRVHTFTGSATFTANIGLSVEYLVVAGGGGGGDRHGGGGGAGGLLQGSMSLSATSYSIVVGGGGVAGNYESSGLSPQGRGGRGTNSTAFGLTAYGGGGGGTYDGNPSGTFGSGGGGGGNNRAGIAGTAGQGYAGGSGLNPGGGGGGGAGAVGGNANNGSGGIGVQWPAGSGTYYAGGGGGAWAASGGPATPGGTGGGGAGAWDDATIAAGTANTGGGGGASRSETVSTTGRAGGSGIIIVRYLVA